MDVPGAAAPPAADGIVGILNAWAARKPEARAFVFLSDRGSEEAVLTFEALAAGATALAQRLAGVTDPGDRALLLFRPGLDALLAFFGCLAAGVIAVPMMVPRRAEGRDAAEAILRDCAPRLALTHRALLASRPDLAVRLAQQGVPLLAVDDGVAPEAAAARTDPLTVHPGTPLFLQYTSGSTSRPKGVMVTTANLMANLGMIRQALGTGEASTFVTWIPLYHDMGLILSCLESVYVGALNVMMAPVSFVQRPMRWLQAIGRYRAEVSAAPNFAYDLSVDKFRAAQMEGVDLSGWAVALNGAEPVRAGTLERFAATFAPYGFRRQALFPAYGMAEATLLISGGPRGAGPRFAEADAAGTRLVSCGPPVAGSRIAIVDPDTRTRLPMGAIGEIWVGGPHVAAGYWGNPDATAATFAARIPGEGDTPWLRTGDLGRLDAAGEIIVSGRLKDLIIIRGQNHHPHDIEDSVQNAHADLRRSGGAAFTIGEPAGTEGLVIVQEVERGFRGRTTIEALEGLIREVVAAEHELAVSRIVLIRPGSLPKTTSGKIQRSLTRQLLLDGALPPAE